MYFFFPLKNGYYAFYYSPYYADEIPDVYIVERLFSSSLVVVVSRSKPRQMNVYHFKKGTEICNYGYSSNILSIRLNRQVRGFGEWALHRSQTLTVCQSHYFIFRKLCLLHCNQLF